MELLEQTLSRETIYSGKVFDIHLDDARLPNGAVARREVVGHSGGVAVLALDQDENILMVRQYRYGAGHVMLEIPAGKLEKGEDSAVCGLRELREETGMQAGEYSHFAALYPTPAYCSERIEIYLARGLVQVGQSLDADELLTVERVPFRQALQWCLDGTITDAKTLTAILKYAALPKE